MRHVPDDELHAYLDQALSRSQGVEIETHLAGCGHCRDRRDNIAALRDRTTALLGQLTPRGLIIPLPFASLAEEFSRRPSTRPWRSQIRRAGLWAAGVAVAVGAGWIGRSILEPRLLAPIPAEGVSPLAASIPTPSNPAADFEARATPLPLRVQAPRFVEQRPTRFRTASDLVPPPVLQWASVGLPNREAITSEAAPVTRPDTHSPFDHIWRSVQWEEALQMAGSALPFIEGMTVVGVLVQPGAQGERPMVIVAQQDASGEVIQSIEGPVAKVNDLLQRQAMPDVHASEVARTPPDYFDGPGGPRRGLRILTVTGRLPVDSLNVLARIAAIR